VTRDTDVKRPDTVETAAPALLEGGPADRLPVAASGPMEGPAAGPCPMRPRHQPETMGIRRSSLVFLVLFVLCLYAILLVGWEVVQRKLYPDMSTGMTHALLVVRAGVITVIACSLVYVLMRRQQRRLSGTADRLAFLLESYKAVSSRNGNGGMGGGAAVTTANGAAMKGAGSSGVGKHERFENPNLVRCRDVFRCENKDCPAYQAPVGGRCWQLVALSQSPRGGNAPRIDIQQCHECKVYKLSCPDELSKLGESFNSLMFLLEEENEIVGRMRAQMVEKQKMVAVGQLAAGIAHEVGNPLSSISSIVQVLKRSRTANLPPDQLELIETHIERITSIVRQVTTLARPKAEYWESVDVGRTLEEAVRLISFDRRARNVEIDFRSPGSLPTTFGVRHELQQVFLNLALNALDAVSGGGKVVIRAARETRDIVVRIRDTGSGIAPEIGRRIFEPFFTTKEPGSGSGLGLAVSYGIVQKHGGTIDFSSVPGEGTEFVVKIPIVDQHPAEYDESKHGIGSGR
jgi:signal transduction histidine kinase